MDGELGCRAPRGRLDGEPSCETGVTGRASGLVTPPNDRTSAAAERPKRPAAVTLVAVLAAGVTVYSAAYGVLAVRAGQDDRLADGVFHLALGAGALVAALGAFRLHRWAWAAFMTWAVIGLTHRGCAPAPPASRSWLASSP